MSTILFDFRFHFFPRRVERHTEESWAASDASMSRRVGGRGWCLRWELLTSANSKLKCRAHLGSEATTWPMATLFCHLLSHPLLSVFLGMSSLFVIGRHSLTSSWSFIRTEQDWKRREQAKCLQGTQVRQGEDSPNFSLQMRTSVLDR
jgi:hypothetical protein